MTRVAVDDGFAGSRESMCGLEKHLALRQGATHLDILVWIIIAMPAAIFLLAARAFVVRGRLESHGQYARGTVTSYRHWTDDMTHHDVTYRFAVGGREYYGSGSADRSYQVGEPIEVMYHSGRPDFNQLVAGGVVTSRGLNVIVMVLMLLTGIWLISLLPGH
jgi:hypothetical protein